MVTLINLVTTSHHTKFLYGNIMCISNITDCTLVIIVYRVHYIPVT